MHFIALYLPSKVNASLMSFTQVALMGLTEPPFYMLDIINFCTAT